MAEFIDTDLATSLKLARGGTSLRFALVARGTASRLLAAQSSRRRTNCVLFLSARRSSCVLFFPLRMGTNHGGRTEADADEGAQERRQKEVLLRLWDRQAQGRQGRWRTVGSRQEAKEDGCRG